ncbi:MAG: hypothetical protein HC912_08295 [Saprospiraceae bacterium]|nr:hypothetical protein [Saprospiraceae bacterium]
MPSEKLLLIVKDDSPASQLVEIYASTLPVAVEVLNLSEQSVSERIWALILEQYRLSDIFLRAMYGTRSTCTKSVSRTKCCKKP